MEYPPTKLETFFEKSLSLLAHTDPDHPPAWGKMSLQGAVEHLEDSLNSVIFGTLDPFIPENQELMIQFIHGPKLFRDNTKHPLLPPEPQALRYPDYKIAIAALRESMEQYLQFWEKSPEAKPVHAGFGSLDQATWDALTQKHFNHHLQQFQLLPR